MVISLPPDIVTELNKIAEECNATAEKAVELFVRDGISGYYSSTPDEFRSTFSDDEEPEADPQLPERHAAGSSTQVPV